MEIFESAADDLHAGAIETSILLHLSQDLVRPGAIDAVPAHPLAYLEFATFAQLSPSGTWGRPSQASAERGRRALEAAVGATVDYIERTFEALGQV
jgi:creatinine amidohydrolase